MKSLTSPVLKLYHTQIVDLDNLNVIYYLLRAIRWINQ